MRIDGSSWAKLAAAALGALAVAMALSASDRAEPAAPPPAPVREAVTDPLRADLARCNRLGPDDPRDPACEAAWEAQRRRFLGLRP